MISDELDTLKKSLVASVAKIEEYKRRHLELSHRVLKVNIVKITNIFFLNLYIYKFIYCL